MNPSYCATLRTVVALITATLEEVFDDDTDDPFEGIAGALMDELKAADPAETIAAFLSVNATLIDCIARGGDIERDDVWQRVSAAISDTLIKLETL